MYDPDTKLNVNVRNRRDADDQCYKSPSKSCCGGDVIRHLQGQESADIKKECVKNVTGLDYPIKCSKLAVVLQKNVNVSISFFSQHICSKFNN